MATSLRRSLRLSSHFLQLLFKKTVLHHPSFFEYATTRYPARKLVHYMAVNFIKRNSNSYYNRNFLEESQHFASFSPANHKKEDCSPDFDLTYKIMLHLQFKFVDFLVAV
jgi:hypothetical protein